MAANEVMGEGVGDIFKQRYFGVPFPVILLGVVGVAMVAKHLINSKKQNVASQPATEGYATDVAGNKFASAYTGQAGGVPFGSGSLTNAVASGVNVVTPPTEINNEGWLRRATEKLNLLGQWNITEIQTALQMYISGGRLDQRQAAIVEQATKVEGVAPINITPGTPVIGASRGTITGYVRNAQTGLIAAQYSDGTLVGVHNPAEWVQLNGGYKADGTFNNPITVTQLPSNDPVWLQHTSV